MKEGGRKLDLIDLMHNIWVWKINYIIEYPNSDLLPHTSLGIFIKMENAIFPEDMSFAFREGSLSPALQKVSINWGKYLAKKWAKRYKDMNKISLFYLLEYIYGWRCKIIHGKLLKGHPTPWQFWGCKNIHGNPN